MWASTYGQLYGTMILTETYNFSVLETGKCPLCATSWSNEAYQTKAREGKGRSSETGEEIGHRAVRGLGYTCVGKLRARYAI